MKLFENPFATLRELEQLHRAEVAYELRLAEGDIDPSGPFIGKPQLTRRETFQEIREAPLPDALKQAWLKWAYRLSDARVNAIGSAAIAHSYRATLHLIEWKDPLEVTLRQLQMYVLSCRGQRQFFLDALAGKSAHLSQLVQRHWARRLELSHRAGFASLDEVESPLPGLESLAQSLIDETDELYAQTVPQELEGFFETALATSSLSGWPAKLSLRSLEQLLGNREWLYGLSLQTPRLPAPLAPASYFRALSAVGKAMADAAPSSTQPFVVARDPSGLFRETLGALVAVLPQSATFNVKNRKLSRPDAQAQARAAALSGLIHARSSALSVILRSKLARSEREFTSDFPALSRQTYGWALPASLAGVLPRLRPTSGQQLLGPLLAREWEQTLVAQFDEDWFRNPRGIESVRARLCDVPEVSLTAERARQALSSFVAALVTSLS